MTIVTERRAKMNPIDTLTFAKYFADLMFLAIMLLATRAAVGIPSPTGIV